MKAFLKLLSVLSMAFFLTAFSCSKKKTIGEPFILYEVHGTVYGTYSVENTDTPQEGDYKRVTSKLKGVEVISDSSSEVAVTSNEGGFVVYGRSTPTDEITLTFCDKDGDQNHGEFLKKEQRITLRKKSSGGDRNYEGYYIATDVEVIMFLKDEELQPDGPEFNQ